MKSITQERLQSLLEQCKGKRIAIIGDVMLDRYIWGKVARISPEAPVPVVEVERESMRLGGAANVANNIASLGGAPVLFGVIGDDHAGKDFTGQLEEKRFFCGGILIDSGRPTTVKTRIIAHNQHVVRTDIESTADISDDTVSQMLVLFKKQISEFHGIIFEDYNKGAVTKHLIKEVIALAVKSGCLISVDPKFNNFMEYKQATVFKPNKIETQDILGFKLDSQENVSIAGRLLLERLKCSHVLITRGAEGMSLFSRDGSEYTVKTKAREIHDVSGAGDTVISTMTIMLAAGADAVEAASIANYAAGVVCGEVGIVPIDPVKLAASIKNDRS